MRAYPGTRYEVYERPTSTHADELKAELSTKTPVLSKVLDIFETPPFESIEPILTSDIGSGLFAVRLSSYFVPPISGTLMCFIGSFIIFLVAIVIFLYFFGLFRPSFGKKNIPKNTIP